MSDIAPSADRLNAMIAQVSDDDTEDHFAIVAVPMQVDDAVGDDDQETEEETNESETEEETNESETEVED